jgi:hypothetical protein
MCIFQNYYKKINVLLIIFRRLLKIVWQYSTYHLGQQLVLQVIDI